MATILPLRLVRITKGELKVIDPRSPEHFPAVQEYGFDIISYTWSDPHPAYQCGIDGVFWDLTIDPSKIREIERLMRCSEEGDDVLPFMWVDCMCINQTDKAEKSDEICKMYQYYRTARKCHILIDMDDPWNPQEIIEDLKLMGHTMTHMAESAVTSEANLTQNVVKKLSAWAHDRPWRFPLPKSMVHASGIEPGLLNCYSTCTQYVRSLFHKFYFTRVWTFEEMLLGKNITMWGINEKEIYCIGAFNTWMDLATESNDKAIKLSLWIQEFRHLTSSVVHNILGEIKDDIIHLASLQRQVRGISCARTDIINGGPHWWLENHKGISNIFSAISLTPRSCYKRGDIFKGLLGVFNGLFTAEELKTDLAGDDIEQLSLVFFKQLSLKTGRAWTRLAISREERKGWDWIPMVADNEKTKLMTTDVFAGVINLGRLNNPKKGQAQTLGVTGLIGVPKKYMEIRVLHQENRGYRFGFTGCNCGKKIKTGFMKSEPIPTLDGLVDIDADQTGRILVHCAMVMGNVIDPGCHLSQYREVFLSNLQPFWRPSDPNAKLDNWFHRSVSGTAWENSGLMRTHNFSMNYNFPHIEDCGSRLENDSTRDVYCEVRVNCGCTMTAPFSWIFEALKSIPGSSLGQTTAEGSQDDRIELKDGLGLIQVGDIGKTFSVVAFGGDVYANRSYAQTCRKTVAQGWAQPRHPWPASRALVRDDFVHGMTDGLRDYGYVPTGGSGNLFICRNQPLDDHRIIGVCIDDFIPNKKGQRTVFIK